MVNMLRALVEKVDHMKEQMGNVSKEMHILRKKQKKMLESKNSVTEMKNIFDGFLSRLAMAVGEKTQSLKISQWIKARDITENSCLA